MDIKSTIFLVVAILFLHTGLLANISVSTRFEPPQISLGDKAQYVVEIVETSEISMPEAEEVKSLPIPESGGLSLRNGRVSTSSQTRIVNFKTSYQRTVQLIIEARAPEIGNYTIPSYRFSYKGTDLTAASASLKVVERDPNAPPSVDELIYLQFDGPKELYVGQSTELELKLYIANDVRLSGISPVESTADGFTLSEIPEQPKESSERSNGRPYRVLTWPLTITPINSGLQNLNFEITVAAQIPGTRNRNNVFGNSSIFDDFFGRSERFNIYTEPFSISVKPLPIEGKPKSFSGAIGDFSMQVYTDLETTSVGEPIMLSLKLVGTGNFDRIQGPKIPENPLWRHYNPEATFEMSGQDPTRGVKRFDYVFIPEKAGTIDLPEIRFAYFDPETKEYVELTSPQIPIEVAPSPRQMATPSRPEKDGRTMQQNVQTPAQPLLTGEEKFLTLDYINDASRTFEMTILKNRWFLSINGLAFASLLGALVFASVKRKRMNDPDYAAKSQTVKELRQAREKAQQAETEEDVEAFYKSAQSCIRLSLTLKTLRNYRTAGIDEIVTSMHALKLKDSLITETKELFESADIARFSGKTPQKQLRDARGQLNRILAAL